MDIISQIKYIIHVKFNIYFYICRDVRSTLSISHLNGGISLYIYTQHVCSFYVYRRKDGVVFYGPGGIGLFLRSGRRRGVEDVERVSLSSRRCTHADVESIVLFVYVVHIYSILFMT